MALVDEESTAQVSGVPVVLVVGCTPEIVEVCRDVSPLGTQVKDCDFTSAPTHAARLRPHVMVLSEDLYAFDPDELDALAQAVGARLAKLPRGWKRPEVVGWIIRAAFVEAKRTRS